MSTHDDWMPEGLSAYERDAWTAIQTYKQQRITQQAKTLVPQQVRQKALQVRDQVADSAVGQAAGGLWEQLKATGYLDKAVEGASAALGDAGAGMVPTSRVRRAYTKHGYELDEIADILKLDLRDIDAVTPRLGRRYAAGAAAEGGAAGFFAGGGTVFAAGGAVAGGVGAAPGLGVVATAMGIDVATAIGSSVTLAGHYGAYCGFDVDTDDPREQAFLLGILGTASAGNMAAKDLAFSQMRQLSMMLVRRTTWSDLNEKVLVKLIDQLFKRLTTRLTKQKLGQALPLVGAGVGAGLNYRLLSRVGRDARMLYRERMLIEKYSDDETTEDLRVEDIEIIPDEEDEGPAAIA